MKKTSLKASILSLCVLCNLTYPINQVSKVFAEDKVTKESNTEVKKEDNYLKRTDVSEYINNSLFTGYKDIVKLFDDQSALKNLKKVDDKEKVKIIEEVNGKLKKYNKIYFHGFMSTKDGSLNINTKQRTVGLLDNTENSYYLHFVDKDNYAAYSRYDTDKIKVYKNNNEIFQESTNNIYRDNISKLDDKIKEFDVNNFDLYENDGQYILVTKEKSTKTSDLLSVLGVFYDSYRVEYQVIAFIDKEKDVNFTLLRAYNKELKEDRFTNLLYLYDGKEYKTDEKKDLLKGYQEEFNSKVELVKKQLQKDSAVVPGTFQDLNKDELKKEMDILLEKINLSTLEEIKGEQKYKLITEVNKKIQGRDKIYYTTQDVDVKGAYKNNGTVISSLVDNLKKFEITHVDRVVGDKKIKTSSFDYSNDSEEVYSEVDGKKTKLNRPNLFKIAYLDANGKKNDTVILRSDLYKDNDKYYLIINELKSYPINIVNIMNLGYYTGFSNQIKGYKIVSVIDKNKNLNNAIFLIVDSSGGNNYMLNSYYYEDEVNLIHKNFPDILKSEKVILDDYASKIKQ